MVISCPAITSSGANFSNSGGLGIGQIRLSGHDFARLGGQLNLAYLRTILGNYHTYLAGNTSLDDLDFGDGIHTWYDDLSHLVEVAAQETQRAATNHGAWAKHVQCNTLSVLVCYQLILATARQQQARMSHH